MKHTVWEFCESMEKLAPRGLALEWDNVGLQVGDADKQVSTVLVTLTITAEVLAKAVAEKVDLIIAHHPVIFKPLQAIRTDQPQGALLAAALKHDISLYVAHTNLDQAPSGLNDWLAQELGLSDVKVLVPGPTSESGLGRVGTIPEKDLGDLAHELEQLWGCVVRTVGDPTTKISTLAVVGGSGGDFIRQAKEAGAQCLITGDVSYHDALDAEALGLALLDAGHFATEKIMVREVAAFLRSEFGDALIVLQETSSNPFRY